MGMDVYGNAGTYFRANIWQWQALCHAMELAGYNVPETWSFNDGDGLEDHASCCALADQLEQFLQHWQKDVLVLDLPGSPQIDERGAFVQPGTPGAQSAYQIARDHIKEFIIFLRECEGFQIH